MADPFWPRADGEILGYLHGYQSACCGELRPLSHQIPWNTECWLQPARHDQWKSSLRVARRDRDVRERSQTVHWSTAQRVNPSDSMWAVPGRQNSMLRSCAGIVMTNHGSEAAATVRMVLEKPVAVAGLETCEREPERECAVMLGTNLPKGADSAQLAVVTQGESLTLYGAEGRMDKKGGEHRRTRLTVGPIPVREMVKLCAFEIWRAAKHPVDEQPNMHLADGGPRCWRGGSSSCLCRSERAWEGLGMATGEGG